MKRKLLDRIHDRSWRELGRILSRQRPLSPEGQSGDHASSVSGTMPWTAICRDFANGISGSDDFRRDSAVRDVVETVGPVDGRFYASRILEWGPAWLDDQTVLAFDDWGSPIRWPGFLLGLRRSFSPTTLRYLATALWLKRSGYVEQGGRIAEIGVGFGGLPAMNALVSGAMTTLIDLPEVEQAAMRAMTEIGLSDHVVSGSSDPVEAVNLMVSNYAFTELDGPTQQHYFDRYIKSAKHCVIISNSSIFASSIRGRTDDELMKWFQSEGLPAKIETSNELLSPGDHLCKVSMIHW